MGEAVDYSLLGTVVRLSFRSNRFTTDAKVAGRVFGEMRRLSGVFNLFDPASALSELRRTSTCASTELADLLTEAERWHRLTDGLFDPAPGAPRLPWRSDDAGGIEIVGDCSMVDLNAIAKGWIVDRAAAEAPAVELVLDAGGDVLHRGQRSALVGIENPLRPYDNEPPLAEIAVSNAAVATSGPSRRGDHLWNPLTGAAPTEVAGATVMAPDAATADVVATALAVGSATSGINLATDLDLAALIVHRRGGVSVTPRWRDLVADTGP